MTTGKMLPNRIVAPGRGRFWRKSAMTVACATLLAYGLSIEALKRRPQTYRASAELTFVSTATEQIEPLRATFQRLDPTAKLEPQPTDQGLRVALEITGNTAPQAERALHRPVENFLRELHSRQEQKRSQSRHELEGHLERLEKREKELTAQLGTSPPIDPVPISTRLERDQARLEELEQKGQRLTEQLSRLAQYRLRLGAPATTTTTLPPDPEVLQLEAQVTLLNEQLDEQINTLHRTEQHPYVRELQGRFSATERKLELAKARAQAGRPPSPHFRPATEAVLPTVALDMQVESLQAEKGEAFSEAKTLRQRIEQDRQSLSASQDRLTRERPIREELVLVSQEKARRGRELAALTPETDPVRVTWQATRFVGMPLAWQWALAAAISSGLGILAGFLHLRLTRRVETLEQLEGLLECPILGQVSALPTRAQIWRRRLGAWMVRPAALAGLLAWNVWLTMRWMGS